MKIQAVFFALVTLALGAASAAERTTVVNDGQTIQFMRTISLEPNRSEKEAVIDTYIADQSRRYGCTLSVPSPALSKPEIQAGTKLKVKWDGKIVLLLNVNTNQLAAKMECVVHSINLGTMRMHPNATWAEKLQEVHLENILSATIVDDVKPVSIGQ